MNKKLLFAILLSGTLGAQTFSNNTLTAIPDNSTTGVTSTIPVSLVKTISDPSKVTVKLDLTHTWAGDLTIALVPPSGPETGAIALLKRLNNAAASGTVGSSANFLAGNVIAFNSAASSKLVALATWTSSTNIPAGTYLPTTGVNTTPTDYTEANLATMFTGLAVSGDWKLKLFDSVTGDTGSVNNWQIVFDPGTFLGVNTSIVSTPGLSVLGNPFKETLNLKVNTSAKDVKFDIYSMDGKKVYSYQPSAKNTSGDLKIPTENWTSGIYILAPTVNGEKMMTIKLIKK
ncbi:proprotein convertase P-domain-containing protein [Epilithonimonas sp. JDS]|uniref:proprotein convertase P-domain-containing protein n=1 Tax=Epilithonimonas sp. JDS TaxID=2902797 RepID=UPI001E5917BA|nr:proprotein convertase P-domain-containing protein [Epilithonimonas sp. JDS]MCD9853222.1 proprotein convertase P-domain-containing protein [Epilithonimonas sp. JDS]